MRKKIIEEEFDLLAEPKSKISTNFAVDHLNGKLTDETLLAMSEDELEKLAYGDVINKDFIKTEYYKRTFNKIEAEKQGDFRDKRGIYEGIHRAKVLLDKRIKEFEDFKDSAYAI